MYIKVCNLHKTLLETTEDEMVAVLESVRANANVSPILLGVCVCVCVCARVCVCVLACISICALAITQTRNHTNIQTHRQIAKGRGEPDNSSINGGGAGAHGAIREHSKGP
jgi:hypothetical protein